MADVLVIIVTYNALDWIDKCLGSVFRSDIGADAIVIDNASTDGTPDLIKTRFPQVLLVQTGKNLGFGAANNIGLRTVLQEGYKFAYLLNQDAWLEKDTLSKLIAAYTAEYGILSPMQLDAEGRMDRNFEKKCSKYLPQTETGKAAEARTGGLDSDRNIVAVPFVMAAHWLMSRKAIETVGGFSPAFIQYGEDDNYIDRLHWNGLKCGIVPKADAVHDRAGRKTSKDDRMRLKCVATVVKVSNPNDSFICRSIMEPLELVGMSIKNLSPIPLKFIATLLGRLEELKKHRDESLKKGAFILESIKSCENDYLC